MPYGITTGGNMESGVSTESKPVVPVSVVIPCYNSADTIERTIRSVVAQTVLPAEVWIINDGSTDNTLSVLEEINARYGSYFRLNIINFPSNRGPSAARNAGWDSATQPYIAFLDADDTWHPKKLEIQYGWMKEHPEVVLTGHPFVWKRENEPVEILSNNWQVQRIKSYAILVSNRFSTPSVMIRRNLPYRFDETKRHSEDFFLWLQVILGGHLAYRLELPLMHLYKAPFGVKGLSGNLWLMEKGEIDTYWKLCKQRYISIFTALALVIYSLLKFLRRIIVSWKFKYNN